MSELREWFSARELAGMPGMPGTERAIQIRSGKEDWRSRARQGRGGGREYHLDSLPAETRGAIIKASVKTIERTAPATAPAIATPLNVEADEKVYSEAPAFARRKADKYLMILNESEGLFGKDLENFVHAWNEKNPDFQTSYPRVLAARKIRKELGKSGLLGHWGSSRKGQSTVDDQCFEYFKNHFLNEARPSIHAVWKETMGWALNNIKGTCPKSFPSHMAFYRKVTTIFSKSLIYRARFGESAWNRKFAQWIDRDYSTVSAGEIWVSDHAQIDVMVEDADGKHVCPWLTAWRDAKSGKMLGYCIHPEPPNSDHIFQAFHTAALKFGLPKHVIIDNGKDYRSRDFAGGRESIRSVKVEVDEKKAKPMLILLDINPHFALPYNAQTKPIERDFLKIKEWFSKRLPGYRGGDVVERPEKLKFEIKSGALLSYDKDFRGMLDSFIENVFNESPSFGKVLQGRTPNAVWNEEFKVKREVRKEALKLFCMRTSTNYTIGRNGIRDGILEATYWGEWMSGCKGDRVYMRRDPQAYQEAWIFSAENDKYLGQATLAGAVPVLAETDVQKRALQQATARKKHERKVINAELKKIEVAKPEDRLFYAESGTRAYAGLLGNRKPEAPTAPVIQMVNTEMDRTVVEKKRQEAEGKADLGKLIPLKKPSKKVYAFASDKETDELELGREARNQA